MLFTLLGFFVFNPIQEVFLTPPYGILNTCNSTPAIFEEWKNHRPVPQEGY